MDFRTPLARVKGSGSAHEGSHHWLAQRLSAIILAILFLWFAFSFATLLGTDYSTAKAWISRPLNTSLLIAFIMAGFYHAILGLQVVIEDYINDCAFKKFVLLTGMKIVLFILGISTVVAVLRAAMGG